MGSTITPQEINMTTKQAKYIRQPISVVNANIIIKKSKFPDGFAGKIRNTLALPVLDDAISKIKEQNESILEMSWVDLNNNERSFLKLLSLTRAAMLSKYYDKISLSLLKKIRCKTNPANYECALRDEL